MYQKILVAIDGSEISTQGLKEAIKFAQSQHSQIRLFHIANDRIVDSGYGDSSYRGQIIECARENGQKVLSGAVALARQHGLEAETVLVESKRSDCVRFSITYCRSARAMQERSLTSRQRPTARLIRSKRSPARS